MVLSRHKRIFVRLGLTDIRQQINRLSSLVQELACRAAHSTACLQSAARLTTSPSLASIISIR
jgi:hypothetical protein